MNSFLANFFPYFAGAFKLIVLAIGGYLAIKWHFDEDRRVKEAAGEVFDRPSAIKKLVTIFAILVFVVLAIILVIYATNWLLYE
ncbi:hypothetical protein SAMN04488136_15018 [Vibrio xiamenensis]|uniref:Uncharacterized protein n=1 Tax=Vibrio xiamenensis TaxID=861298 RepID=A0A1G8HF48_9VIBR|nr:hypothetical protein [Vibrio xiamenensis]SDI05307.1 hypothetical protein SAMN04488136_15018 [Vibrio xiamenensis]